MAKKQDPSQGDHTQMNVFTGVVVVFGIIAAIVAYLACQDESLTTVDRLARYDLGFSGAFVLTIKKCAEFAAVAGLIIAVLAIVGLIGTKQSNKQLTCIYNVGLIIGAVVMLGLGVHSLLRQGTMEPIITRQIGDFCQEPTFIRLTQQLNCTNTAGPLAIAAGASPSPCSAACLARVETLRSTNEGCLMLEGLCNNFLYPANSAAAVPGFEPPYYSATAAVVPIAERCERKCDHDMLCAGFSFGPSGCLIKSANVTRYLPPTWTSVTARYPEIPAQMKGENAVLHTFTTYGYGVAWILIILGIALIIMWVLTMRILYNQNINKPGKPSAHQVGIMLCCPCLGGDEYREPLDDGTDYSAEE